MPGLENTTIYICTICTNTQAKPGFCSGGRISSKPNNGALLSTNINKNDDSKSLHYCTLLGTRTNSHNDSKSIGAGMDILGLLLAEIIETFIVQLVIDVTMIATMVLLIILYIRTTILVRVLVTATVKYSSNNNNKDHDSSTKGTSKSNSITSNTCKKTCEQQWFVVENLILASDSNRGPFVNLLILGTEIKASYHV